MHAARGQALGPIKGNARPGCSALRAYDLMEEMTFTRVAGNTANEDQKRDSSRECHYGPGGQQASSEGDSGLCGNMGSV